MVVSFTYLNHCIEIDLPDPEDSNIIYITLTKAALTFDPAQETGFLTSYQFTPVADDPNQWLVEAVSSAIRGLANRGIQYYSQPPLPVLAAENDLSDVIF